MSVQAKVRCIGNSPPAWDNGGSSGSQVARFTPVYDTNPDHPNFEWSRYTPSGYIELTVTNEAAFSAFEVNREYLLTFEPLTGADAGLQAPGRLIGGSRQPPGPKRWCVQREPLAVLIPPRSR